MSMSMNIIAIILLLLVVLLNSIRLLMQLKTQAMPLRLLVILLLQAGSAVLFFFTLFPPERYAIAERLQILTAHATQFTNSSANVRVIALPEAPKDLAVQRVPDLATALRTYPGVTDIEVLGDGLPVRDWDAAQTVSVRYRATPIKKGIIELGLPEVTMPGERWTISGRVAQSTVTTVELLDPGHMVVARVGTDAKGNFALSDTARGQSNVLYQLRVLDAQKQILETISFPVMTKSPQSIRILSLSGGANPELKYLKRWAIDAGVSLQSSIALGLGMQIQTAPVSFNAASLGEVDLLMLDERAWMSLSAGNKQAVRDALQKGMGVLLRITGPLEANARAQWRALGFTITESDAVQMLRLPEPNQQTKLPELTRQPIRVLAADGVSLINDNRGDAIGMWRAEQLGRVGVWWLNDSFSLVLAGHPEVYGAMWSKISTTLARAKQKPILTLPTMPIWANQRTVFCGLANSARVETAQGQQQGLLIGRQGEQKNCAAYWPEQAGWYTLKSADQTQAFYVHAANDAPTLHQRAIQQAMLRLEANKPQSLKDSRVAIAGLHWPYFLAWLLITTLLWWLERIRWAIKK